MDPGRIKWTEEWKVRRRWSDALNDKKRNKGRKKSETRSVKFMMKCRSCNIFYFRHESYQPTASLKCTITIPFVSVCNVRWDDVTLSSVRREAATYHYLLKEQIIVMVVGERNELTQRGALSARRDNAHFGFWHKLPQPRKLRSGWLQNDWSVILGSGGTTNKSFACGETESQRNASAVVMNWWWRLILIPSTPECAVWNTFWQFLIIWCYTDDNADDDGGVDERKNHETAKLAVRSNEKVKNAKERRSCPWLEQIKRCPEQANEEENIIAVA